MLRIHTRIGTHTHTSTITTVLLNAEVHAVAVPSPGLVAKDVAGCGMSKVERDGLWEISGGIDTRDEM
jgi:hypothetical protein